MTLFILFAPSLTTAFPQHFKVTLEKLIIGLRNRRIPEEQLTELERAWQGATITPEKAQEEPESPAATRASVAELTASGGQPASVGASITEVAGGGWLITVPVPASFPAERLGEILVAARSVIFRSGS